MSEVENRIVEMKFKHDEFSKGIQQTLTDLERLDESLKLKNGGKGLQGVQAAANALNLSNVIENVNKMAETFLFQDSVIGHVVDNLKSKFANFATSMAKSLSIDQVSAGFKEYELKMGSVQTIMAGSGASMEEVNGYLEELNEYSDKTIYSFSDMTSSIGKFTNAGVSLDKAVKAIQGISNEAARSGANAQQASAAMYNFSQALSSGAVKLIDWKSIENANMATVEFKQQLLETAVALGTVRKEGDRYISTTTDMNGHVSEAFTATSMFNDSLSSLWMTSDVLTQTLANYSTDVREMTNDEHAEWRRMMIEDIHYTEEQVDAIEKLGSASFDAAQDVKSYTMMMDALQEAIGSGWATTFEIIFGNLEEAKEMWTALNNVLSGTIGAIGEVRNGILKVWKARGGRDQMLNAIANIWHGVEGLVKPIMTAIDYFVPSVNVLGIKLYKATEKFAMFTRGMRVSDELAKNITDTFKLLILPITTIGKMASSVFGAVIPFGLRLVGSLFENLFKLTGSLARSLNFIFSPVENFTKTFDKKIKALVKYFEHDLITLPTAFVQTLINLGKAVKVNVVQTFEKARNVVVPFFEKINDIFTTFSNTISKGLKRSGVTDFVDKIVDTFNKITSLDIGFFDKVAVLFSKATNFKAIGDQFASMVNIPKLLQSVSGALGRLNADIYKLTGINIKKVGGDVVNFFKEVGSAIDQATIPFQDAFIAFGKSIDQALSTNGWYDYITGIENAFKSLWLTTKDLFSFGLPDFFNQSLEKATELWGDLVEAFNSGTSITDFFMKAGTAAEKFGKAVVDIFFGNKIEALGTTFTSLSNYLDDLGADFVEVGKAFTNGFNDLVNKEGLIGDVARAFDTLGTTLLGLLHLDGVIDKIKDLEAFDKVKTTILDLKKVIFDFFNAKIITRFKNGIASIKDNFEDVRLYFKSKLDLDGIVNGVKENFKTLKETVLNLLGTDFNPVKIFGNLKTAFTTFATGLTQTFEKNVNVDELIADISTSVQEFIERAKEFWNVGLPELFEKLKQKADGVLDTLKNLGGDAGTKVAVIFDKIKMAVSELPGWFSKATEKVGEFFDTIANSKVIKGVQEVFEPMTEWLKNSRLGQAAALIFDKIKDTFTSIQLPTMAGLMSTLDKIKSFKFDGSGFAAFAEKLKEFFETVKEISTEKLDTIREKLTTFIESLKEKVGPAKETMLEFKDSLMGTFRDILDKFKNFNWQPVLDIVKGAAALYAFWQIIKMIDSLTSAATIVSTIKGMFTQIGKAAGAFKWQLIADAFLKAGMAVVAITGAILLLGSMDPAKLENAVVAISTIILMMSLFVGALALFKKFSSANAAAVASAKEGKKGAQAMDNLRAAFSKFFDSASDAIKNAVKKAGRIIGAVGILVAVGAAIFLIVKSFTKIHAIVKNNANSKTLLITVGILGAIAAILAAFLLLASKSKGADIGDALSILFIGIALQQIVKAFGKLNEFVGHENYDKTLKAITTIGIILGALILVSSKAKNVKSFGTAFVMIALALRVVSKPLQELTNLAGNNGAKFKGVAVGLSLLFGALTAAIVVLSNFAAKAVEQNLKGFIGGLTGLIAMAGTMWVLADSLEKIGSLKNSWSSLGVLVVALGALVVGLTAIGAIGKYLGAGLIAVGVGFAAVGAAVLMAGLGVELFGAGIKAAAMFLPMFATNLVVAAKTITENGEQVLNAISVIIAGIIVGICNSIAVIIDAIVVGIDQLILALDAHLPQLVEHLLVFCGHLIVVLCNVLGAGIMWIASKIGPKAVEVVGGLISTIVQNVLTNIEVFLLSLKLKLSYFKQLLTTGASLIKYGFAALMEWVSERVKNSPSLSALFEAFGVDAEAWAAEAKATAEQSLADLNGIEERYAQEREQMLRETQNRIREITNQGYDDRESEAEVREELFAEKMYTRNAREAEIAAQGARDTASAVRGAMAEEAPQTESEASAYGENIGNILSADMLASLQAGMAQGASSTDLLNAFAGGGFEMGDSSMAGIIEGIEDGNPTVLSQYTGVGEDASNAFGDAQNLDGEALLNMYAAAGAINRTNAVNNAASSAGRKSGDAMGNAGYSHYYNSGSYSMDGGARGIRNNTYKVENAARDAAIAANNAYNAASEIGSPSKKFAESGMFQMMGGALGIAKNQDMVVQSSYKAGAASVEAFSDAVNTVSSVGYKPRISPVLDISSFRANAGVMNGVFDRTATMQANFDTSGLNLKGTIDTFSKADIRRNSESVNTLNKLNDTLSNLGDRISRMEVKLNDGTLVGKITTRMDQALGKEAVLKARGN